MLARRPPLVAVTQGDPAGIGPEVIVGAWPDRRVHACCQPFVVGQPDVFRRAAKLFQPSLEVVEISRPEEAAASATVLPCLRCGDQNAVSLTPGLASAAGGQAAYDALVVAAELALAGRVDAISTAPLSKSALWQAGHKYPGHTELLGELCGVDKVAMMLYLPPGPAISSPSGLGVIHVTLHMALREALAQLNPEAIVATCRLAHQSLRNPEGGPPRLGVCALNPHAGEEGLFGNEEITIIAPAVEQGRRENMNLIGPLPADTLMVRARHGEFDGVIAMYHDQGHIALKLLGMHRAVNVTLGLPIVRTSVAHGTAFDRAWQGQSDHGGMVAALQVAGQWALRRSGLA